MKGKVLGFTPAAGSGAITGENGERFTFTAEQWRGEQPITVGTSVDFAPVEGAATEIYPVASASAMPAAAADLMAGPTAQKLRTLSMTTLAFPLAALLLFATVLPALNSPMGSPSIWSLGSLSTIMSVLPIGNESAADVANEIKALQQQALQLRTHTTGMFGMPVDNSQELVSVNQSIATAQKKLSDAQMADTVKSALVIRWTVPILAVILLWFCWVGKELRTMTLVTGAAAIVTAIIIYTYLQTLVGGVSGAEGSLGSMMSQQLGAVLTVGIGTYLIGLLGIGLILGGLGYVRNPLAAKAA